MSYWFICYERCNTCAKAREFLRAHNLPFTERDIKGDRPSRAELAEWVRRSGLPVRRFFNTSGLKYKELQLKDRLPTMPEAEQLELLAADGMLVKRPLLIGPDTIRVGFRPAEWESLQ